MLNLEETLDFKKGYGVQRDFYLKTILYSIGALTLLDIIRGQLPEVNILQLVPGLYLALLLCSLIVLVKTSDILVGASVETDMRKDIGIKMMERPSLITGIRMSFSYFLTTLLFVLNTLVPLSLDSFNFLSEPSLENVWSLDEVIILELILLSFILFLSQAPVAFTSSICNEKSINRLPAIWKTIVLLAVIFAGIITPSVDAYTQSGFAASAVSLYVLIINIIKKRVFIKFIGFSSMTA